MIIVVVVFFGLIVLGLGALFLSAIFRGGPPAGAPTVGAATQGGVLVQTSMPPATSVLLAQPSSAPTQGAAATEAVTPGTAATQPALTQPPSTNVPATVRPSATTGQSTNLQPASAGPSNTPAPNATPTLEDNPSLLLTPFVPPTTAPTPVPLPTSSSGSFVELQVAQVQRIQVSDGYILMADIGNIALQPIKDVNLIFTNASGARVGDPKSLSLYLLPNDARPGATGVLAATDPIIVNWGNLQARAIGTPVTTSGQAGYPVWLDITPVTVSLTQDGYTYQSLVTNNSGARANIPYQNVSFFANDGTLLFVTNIGSHPALNDGESYILSGSVPINQTATGGRALGEYTDVLASVSAEVAP